MGKGLSSLAHANFVQNHAHLHSSRKFGLVKTCLQLQSYGTGLGLISKWIETLFRTSQNDHIRSFELRAHWVQVRHEVNYMYILFNP